jgi:hypothetical protein
MFQEFWNEILANTSPCGKYLKHGEVLLKLKKKEENILKIREIISFNPIQANKTLIFLANLADKSATLASISAFFALAAAS